MFQLNKWRTLHVYSGGESQDELQSVEEEGGKYEEYKMEVRDMMSMLIIYM